MALRSLDLMIGDWVEINDIPKQIKFIDDCINHKIIAHGVNKDGKTIVYVGKLNEEVKPIPLTPEILEKNGFRIIFEGELHVSYFQDIERFHIEVKVDKIGIYQKLSMLDGLGNGATIVECKYVHQLQHALRLCRIEKEIIL